MRAEVGFYRGFLPQLMGLGLGARQRDSTTLAIPFPERPILS